MSSEPEIHGTCSPAFERVRAAFARNFAKRDELGASVAVMVAGAPVVNLWAGWADPEQTQPWQPDTLTHVWSVTKAMTAVSAHLLIDRRELDPDTPVARYWPEFAASGKDGITVRWLMSHRAGLAGWAEPVTAADLLDWEKMTALLAAQEPMWAPGTASGYHAVTFGFLVGEVIRRITGRTVGEFFAAEIAKPLGADVHIGVAEADLRRCSALKPHWFSKEERAALRDSQAHRHPAAAAAFANPGLKGGETNDPAWRMAEIPSVNGHATALGLATVMGSLVDGSQRLMSEETLRLARTGQGRGMDLSLGVPVEFCLGMMLSGPEGNYGSNPEAFGHDGFGGASVFADPATGMSFAYVMNRMGAGLVSDPRRWALMNAVYASLQ